MLSQAQSDGLELSHCSKYPFATLSEEKGLGRGALSALSTLSAPSHPHWVLDLKRSFNASLVPFGGIVQAPGEPLSQLGHQGWTPLLVATREGRADVVRQLVTAGPLGVDLKTSRRKVERGSPLRDAFLFLGGGF